MVASVSNRSRSAGAAAALACLGFTATGCAIEPMDAEPDGMVDEMEGEAELEGESAGAGAFGLEPVEPCLTERDFVSRGVVRFGLTYEPFTPPCVRLASGGTVIFQGQLAEHPIEPRTMGTAPSPIEPTAGGSRVEFEFPDQGTFPYRCTRHPDEMGVVWSSWQ